MQWHELLQVYCFVGSALLLVVEHCLEATIVTRRGAIARLWIGYG